MKKMESFRGNTLCAVLLLFFLPACVHAQQDSVTQALGGIVGAL